MLRGAWWQRPRRGHIAVDAAVGVLIAVDGAGRGACLARAVQARFEAVAEQAVVTIAAARAVAAAIHPGRRVVAAGKRHETSEHDHVDQRI